MLNPLNALEKIYVYEYISVRACISVYIYIYMYREREREREREGGKTKKEQRTSINPIPLEIYVSSNVSMHEYVCIYMCALT